MPACDTYARAAPDSGRGLCCRDGKGPLRRLAITPMGSTGNGTRSGTKPVSVVRFRSNRVLVAHGESMRSFASPRRASKLRPASVDVAAQARSAIAPQFSRCAGSTCVDG